ncbi:MAG: DUF4270 domain-containing protein, partial [Cytophagales bacterium]|nr:DUF4270 domain-containing protein [Cytophagales bacterium]
GELSHKFFTMFRLTADSLKTSSSGSNNFEGLYLTLEADGYIFGSDENISLDVYELGQNLRNTSKKDVDYYYSKDDIPNSQFKRKISQENSFNLNEDSTLTIRLIDDLGQEFFRRQNEFSDKENFTQKDFNEFFKGIAVLPAEDSHNIIGINNIGINNIGINNKDKSYLSSYLSLKYTTHSDTTFEIKYYLNQKADTVGDNYVTGYNHYKANRAGTPLANLTEFNKDFQPSDGKFYVQSAYGLHSAIDFSKIYERFKDTTIIINYAEFEMPVNREEPKYVTPPARLGFTYIYSDASHDKFNKRILAPRNPASYYRTMQSDLAYPLSLGNDMSGNLNMDTYTYYSGRKFNGLVNTIYFQSLLDTYNGSARSEFKMKDDNGNLFNKVLIDPRNGRSQVNFLTGNQSDIKLKIYYTKLK